MQPYESSDIGIYELERVRINKREKMKLAHKDPELFKKIKHHKDCIHTKYLLINSWVYPCHPDCEVEE